MSDRALRDWFRQRCVGEWFRPHVERYVVTAQALLTLSLMPDTRVLDVGGGSPLREWLGLQCEVTGTDDGYDLRDIRAWPMPGCFDIVLCSEVLEHLKDTDDAPRDTFTCDGARTLLSRCAMSLKPGGWLVLTTPNGCATHMLSKICDELAPRMYAPHVREYGPHEVSEMLDSAGLQVERMETRDVWGISIRRDVAAFANATLSRPELHGEMILAMAARMS